MSLITRPERGAIAWHGELLKRIGKLLCAATIIFLFACASPPPNDTVEVIDLEAVPAGELALPQRRLESGGGSAVDQLLQQAAAAIAQERFEQASALVERALRISPHDPRAYFALAQVNFFQQRQALAESLLQKARALAVNDDQLLMSIETFGRQIASGAHY